MEKELLARIEVYTKTLYQKATTYKHILQLNKLRIGKAIVGIWHPLSLPKYLASEEIDDLWAMCDNGFLPLEIRMNLQKVRYISGILPKVYFKKFLSLIKGRYVVNILNVNAIAMVYKPLINPELYQLMDDNLFCVEIQHAEGSHLFTAIIRNCIEKCFIDMGNFDFGMMLYAHGGKRENNKN
jgi:hypothetical protein